ncbi:MAG: DNA-binding protein [Candidatus Omnitrophota bacterium]
MLILWFLTLGGNIIAPAPVSISDLITQSRFYDGRVIVTEGEAIGDLMLRGEYGWVNLNDGNSAIGVYAPSEYLDQIKHLGRYKIVGDRVRVTGTFYDACPVHYGQTGIHASRIEIIRSGNAVDEILDRSRLKLSSELALLAILAFALRQFFRRASGGQPKR